MKEASLSHSEPRPRLSMDGLFTQMWNNRVIGWSPSKLPVVLRSQNRPHPLASKPWAGHFKTLFPGWWFGTWIFIFPYIGLLIIPIDVHIFQRGEPTTNQFLFCDRLWWKEIYDIWTQPTKQRKQGIVNPKKDRTLMKSKSLSKHIEIVNAGYVCFFFGLLYHLLYLYPLGKTLAPRLQPLAQSYQRVASRRQRSHWLRVVAMDMFRRLLRKQAPEETTGRS